MALVPVTNDLFDIAWRLRAVNDDYRLFYNTLSAKYEVHSAERGTVQFVVPFDALDARTVEYARRTRVQNAREIFDEIERANADADKLLARKKAERVLQAVSERRSNE